MRVTRLGLRLTAAVLAALPLWIWTPGALTSTAAPMPIDHVVVLIDPILVAPNNVENDEHPPSNVQVGEQFVSQVIGTLFRSPNWSSSALFLTYDEHGGFFDHAPPPLLSHIVNDHTSILRLIETRFGLPAMSRRDAAANPMLEFFDFSTPTFSTPPSLPPAPLNPAEAAYCATQPSNTLP